ncbi:MAG: hypothetical protein SFV81_10900 [Pirellulaceae bacterium]|nr:hypothetical protein [Pirellulaceae bacterium]
MRSREGILTNLFSKARLNMKIYLTAILCAIALVSTAGQASAQCGVGFGYGGFGGYYNYGIQPYVPAPPYFALHPPVYYGARYTRPYGDSPFAAPSQLQPTASYAPARHVERSLTVNNPYVIMPMAPATLPAPAPAVQPDPVPAPVNAPAPSPVVVKPLVIDNPYFQPEVKLVDGQK